MKWFKIYVEDEKDSDDYWCFYATEKVCEDEEEDYKLSYNEMYDIQCYIQINIGLNKSLKNS